MTEFAFFDTNILVYPHDRRSPDKRSIALGLFRRYFGERRGVLSTQVLQEFYVATTRKIGLLTGTGAAVAVADFAALDNLVIIDPAHILDATRLQLRWQLSFWDGLILAAAKAAGAALIYTEDLSHGQRYEGIQAVNPFSRTLNAPTP